MVTQSQSVGFLEIAYISDFSLCSLHCHLKNNLTHLSSTHLATEEKTVTKSSTVNNWSDRGKQLQQNVAILTHLPLY